MYVSMSRCISAYILYIYMCECILYNYSTYEGVYQTLDVSERIRCLSKMCRSAWFIQGTVCMAVGVYMYVREGI